MRLLARGNAVSRTPRKPGDGLLRVTSHRDELLRSRSKLLKSFGTEHHLQSQKAT